MDKVFGIGLSKTATNSLEKAMQQLGYKTVHYPSPQEYDKRNDYEFMCDLPIPPRFKQLDKEYPQARFVLTTRDTESWLKSVKRHMIVKKAKWQMEYRREAYGTHEYNEQVLIESYEKHNQEVKNYFRDTNKLLVLDISEPDKWEKLCSFLGVKKPSVPYPTTNVYDSKKLNLGCGTDIKEGWVNADKCILEPGVIRIKFEERFRFGNNIFSEVYVRHALEHSRNVIFTMEEIWRVCLPNARIKIIVPHASWHSAMTNLTHFQAFGIGSFTPYIDNNKRNYYSEMNFRLVKEEFTIVFGWKITGLVKRFANNHKEWFERHLTWLFPIKEISYELEVKK